MLQAIEKFTYPELNLVFLFFRFQGIVLLFQPAEEKRTLFRGKWKGNYIVI